MCGIYCWVRLSRTTGSIVNTWLRLFGGIQPPRLVSVLPETRFAWQILFVQQGFFFKIHFIFWEERKNHLQFASTTTVEVLCAETFSEWLSAVWSCSSVWGRNLSSPNYHQLHACMDGKEKKNCEWKLIYQCLDRSAIVQWEMYTTCFMGPVLWTYFCEEFLCGGGIFFFILPRSDLLLPVNSCECVAQDFLSICKSKKFFFPLFSSRLFCLYSLTLWKNENERMAGEKTFSAAGVNLKEPV